MERINNHQANTGVKSRINKGSSPFMTPLLSQKRVVDSKVRPTPILSGIKTEQSTAQPLPLPSSSLTFEQEQASILERNEREERERTVSKYLRLAAKANNMGVLQERTGKVAKALRCYLVALKAARDASPSDSDEGSSSKMSLDAFPQEINGPIVIKMADKDVSSEKPFMTLCILCNLGSLYRRSGRVGRSLEFFNIAYGTVAYLKEEDESEEEEENSPDRKSVV